MPHLIGSIVLLAIGLSSAGCVQARIQVVDQRTALENQILGSYEELDRDLQLVASVRAVDEDGQKSRPPRFSDIRKQAIQARQAQQFNRDDVDELKGLGCLGETLAGQLVARPCDAASDRGMADRIERLVKEENESRQVLIRFVVTTSPDLTEADSDQLARAWAQMHRERAEPGTWIQNEKQDWVQK